MSLTTRRPLRLGGASFHSGMAHTGEVMFTRGGAKHFTSFSGGLLPLGSGDSASRPVAQTADHAVIWSGAGRLNTAFAHQAISGVAIVFYDSAIVARSGPTTNQESGRATIGFIPAVTFAGLPSTILSGIYDLVGPDIFRYDAPFYSGLAVSAPSGCAGFTVTWTPEQNPTYGE